MAKYAVVSPADAILEFRNYDTPPNAVTTSSTKPRLCPVVLSDVVYDPISEVRLGPTYTVAPTQVTESYTKRAKTAAEIQAMKDAKIAAIHNLGDSKLSALVTLAKQVQALTRLVQLLYQHTDMTTWTAADKTVVNNMASRLSNIQSIRQTEDTKVNDVTALTLPSDINAYDITLGW